MNRPAWPMRAWTGDGYLYRKAAQGMDKQSIRASYRERRKRLAPGDAESMQRGILEVFRSLRLPSLRVLHRYMPNPKGGEPDPGPLAEWLVMTNPGIVQALPRVSEDDPLMQAIELGASTRLKPNSWGIPEPVEGSEIPPENIDMVLVPLLAFDLKGHRVGHGKGYYDRFLKRCRRDCLKVGLSFFEPVASIDDADAHDERLDLCITPSKAYEFD